MVTLNRASAVCHQHGVALGFGEDGCPEKGSVGVGPAGPIVQNDVDADLGIDWAGLLYALCEKLLKILFGPKFIQRWRCKQVFPISGTHGVACHESANLTVLYTTFLTDDV